MTEHCWITSGVCDESAFEKDEDNVKAMNDAPTLLYLFELNLPGEIFENQISFMTWLRYFKQF